MSYGFDAPVGTDEERHSKQIWPGRWVDATGWAVQYPPSMHRVDYHTGADLNLNFPTYDADAHSGCYAAADGVVKVSDQYPTWGAIVVIEHDDVPEAGRVYTRYAHLEAMLVNAGQGVTRGQAIGRIGNANGRFAYHLHFDVARVDLGAAPMDWPNTDLRRLKATYFDPAKFIREHRGIELQEGPGAQPTRRVITAEPRLRIRKEPTTSAAVVGYVATGTVVVQLSERDGWGLIAEPLAGWIDLKWTRLSA